MMRTLDLRGRHLTPSELLEVIPRAAAEAASVAEVVAGLIADVRARGAAALRAQAERFDRVSPPHLRVPVADIHAAEKALTPDVRAALLEAIDRVRRTSLAQVPPDRTTTVAPGARIVQRWQPVRRVGLYVPGGKAVYPSSVIMNVVAAHVAGVPSIAIASPPQAESNGSVHPTILGAASLLGVEEVWAMGGAGAIGALAYGVDALGLEPVQVITGPGNRYVATAKRLVTSVVGIDSEAGPTEILIIADHSARPEFVVADLVSQAEHDEVAAGIVVTDDEQLAHEVAAQLPRAISATHHRERVETALRGPQSAIVLVDDLEQAARFSNAYGPEHLEVQVSKPAALLPSLENAGAIFMGDHTPVSLGDYLAGSNHVLPTGGQARFSAGLGAYTFLRPQQIVEYDRSALESVSQHVIALSAAEQLPAHGDAVRARFL